MAPHLHIMGTYFSLRSSRQGYGWPGPLPHRVPIRSTHIHTPSLPLPLSLCVPLCACACACRYVFLYLFLSPYPKRKDAHVATTNMRLQIIHVLQRRLPFATYSPEGIWETRLCHITGARPLKVYNVNSEAQKTNWVFMLQTNLLSDPNARSISLPPPSPIALHSSCCLSEQRTGISFALTSELGRRGETAEKKVFGGAGGTDS